MALLTDAVVHVAALPLRLLWLGATAWLRLQLRGIANLYNKVIRRRTEKARTDARMTALAVTLVHSDQEKRSLTLPVMTNGWRTHAHLQDSGAEAMVVAVLLITPLLLLLPTLCAYALLLSVLWAPFAVLGQARLSSIDRIMALRREGAMSRAKAASLLLWRRSTDTPLSAAWLLAQAPRLIPLLLLSADDLFAGRQA